MQKEYGGRGRDQEEANTVTQNRTHMRTTIADIAGEAERSKALSDYEAVDVLWVCVVKLANLCKGKNEHERVLSLVDTLQTEEIRDWMNSAAVDALLQLDPPLETVLANPYERLAAEDTAAALETVRRLRKKDPRGALHSFGDILKRIRNKRAHGFKSAKGPRDQQILHAARTFLAVFCAAGIRAMDRLKTGQAEVHK